MKKILLYTLTVLTGLSAAAQGCNELFISEYIEGWSNNKALEIFNPTDNAIDLSGYSLERYSNGSTTAAANQKIDLIGMLQPHSVIVVVIEKLDPDGIDQESPVWEELQNLADLFLCPVYDDNNTMYFNGNDAMVLRKTEGNAVVDVFGKIGQDPGNPSDGGGWNNVAPDFTNALNQEEAWSTDHTLIRKASIMGGDVNPVDAFDVSVGWDSLPANTFTNLGMHTSDCGSTNVRELNFSKLSVFPNPSADGIFTLEGATSISGYQVFTADANEAIREVQLSVQGKFEVNLGDLPSGIYILRTQHVDGSFGWARLIKR
jgi:hypothetical protein